MYLNKAAKLNMVSMIGELAWLASAKDIDAALQMGREMASQCGIGWESIPQLVELSENWSQ